MQLEESIAKELAAIVRAELALCIAECKRLIAEMPKPEKGDKGERGDKGEKGDPGPMGIPGRDGLPGINGRDGKDGAPGPDGKDGAPGIAGKDGRDGIDGKDGAGPSRGRHRGPWKHDAEYVADDMVSYDNSGWVALIDKPAGRPGNGSKDWMLFVRKGRDGKDGDRGPPGPVGPPGKDASY